MIKQLPRFLQSLFGYYEYDLEDGTVIGVGGRSKAEADKIAASFNSLCAEVETARKLGFDICDCTYPEQIMLFVCKKRANICPRCKKANPVNRGVSTQGQTT